jgi:hypothetical protein
VDINECETTSNLCFGGQCKNTIGNYICQCPTGFKTNTANTHCEDIDECRETSPCINGECK